LDYIRIRKVLVSVVVVAVLLMVFVVGFRSSRPVIPSVSAVETTENVGVYWDENCSLSVYSIDWGVLSPGEFKDIIVYARNEGTTPFFLTIRLTNPSPGNIFDYLQLSLSCEDKLVEVGEVIQVTQRLFVDPSTKGISTFSFGILFDGGPSVLGDMNYDGMVNRIDLNLFAQCYKGLGSPETMYLADLGGGTPPQFYVCDGVVDAKDAYLFYQCFTGSSP
jgi:hypothetical protein